VKVQLNKKFDNAYVYALRVLRPVLLTSPSATPAEQAAILNATTFEQLEEFVTSLAEAPNQIQCLGFGNIIQTQVTEYSTQVAATFQRVPVDETHSKDFIVLPEGRDTTVDVPAPNPDDVNSVLLSIYEFPVKSSTDAMALELIQFILDQDAYAQLRTQEQLGYVVGTYGTTVHAQRYNVSLYQVLIQSGEQSPQYLDERAEAFLSSAVDILYEQTDDELWNAKVGLWQSKWPVPLKLTEEFQTVFTEISSHTFQFTRAWDEGQALGDITREHVLEVYDRVLLNKEKRRKARLLIYGKGKTADPSERSMNPVSLDGLKQWKEGLDMLRG